MSSLFTSPSRGPEPHLALLLLFCHQHTLEINLFLPSSPAYHHVSVTAFQLKVTGLMISHENCALKFIYIYSPVGWSRLRKDSNWCGFITMSGYHSWETTSMTRTLRKTAWMSPPAYFQRMRRSWKSSFTQVNDQFILSDVKSHES